MKNNKGISEVISSQRGFTLIELSIVLVIIGLLVGGVLVGRDLIRAAEIRTTISEIEKIETAVNAYRGKYNALPGDDARAENYFGTDPAGCPSNGNQTAHSETCNGDGNGMISDITSGGWIRPSEMYRVWQQLAGAQLVEGTFTGVTASGAAYVSRIGVNVPKSRTPNAGYNICYYKFPTATFSVYPFMGHVINFGGDVTADVNVAPIITAVDALSIDQKIDNGRPGFGRVSSWQPGGGPAPTCTTNADPTLAEYNTSTTGMTCSLNIKAAF